MLPIKQVFWGFLVGFFTCYVIVRVFKTQDADVLTYLILASIPFWLMSALTADE